jgi:hypothetical protein
MFAFSLYHSTHALSSRFLAGLVRHEYCFVNTIFLEARLDQFCVLSLTGQALAHSNAPNGLPRRTQMCAIFTLLMHLCVHHVLK